MRYLVLLPLVIRSSTFPQVNSNTTPEEISTIAMVALKQRDYEAFASLKHPDALEQMRNIADLIVSVSERDFQVLNFFDLIDVNSFHTSSDTLLKDKA